MKNTPDDNVIFMFLILSYLLCCVRRPLPSYDICLNFVPKPFPLLNFCPFDFYLLTLEIVKVFAFSDILVLLSNGFGFDLDNNQLKPNPFEKWEVQGSQFQFRCQLSK